MIAARMHEEHEEEAPAASDDVVSLAAERRKRRAWPAARGWAAAAAVLVVGIALGRATAPAPTETGTAVSPIAEAPALESDVRPTATALDFAAFEHLGRSESLLAMVRADAREGRVDPAVAPQSHGRDARQRRGCATYGVGRDDPGRRGSVRRERVVEAGQIANFREYSFPQAGAYLLCVSVLLILLAGWFSRKETFA